MYINGKPVGNGQWKHKSVKKFCERKKIELHSAYTIFYDCSGAQTSTMNIVTGLYVDNQPFTDHYARMGLS